MFLIKIIKNAGNFYSAPIGPRENIVFVGDAWGGGPPQVVEGVLQKAQYFHKNFPAFLIKMLKKAGILFYSIYSNFSNF